MLVDFVVFLEFDLDIVSSFVGRSIFQYWAGEYTTSWSLGAAFESSVLFCFSFAFELFNQILFLLSVSCGADVAISSPFYFSAQVLCFGQELPQQDTAPLFLLRRARGNPPSYFDFTFVRG